MMSFPFRAPGGTGVGTFRIDGRIANVADRGRTADGAGMLVDRGSECTWVPEEHLARIGVEREKKDLTFVMANGQRITRNVGFAIVFAGGSFTVDEVVFGQAGDLALLGARSLEGLNLRVDPANKKLVAAGPLPAAGLTPG